MANPLDQLKNILSGLFQSKDKSVVGIDIGASAIKVVQMREVGGKAILETYGSIALSLYDDDEETNESGDVVRVPKDKLVIAIQDLLKEANVTTKRAAVSLPAAATLVFTVTLPASVDKKDFKTVVPMEARRYIPVDISEVSLDWWVLPEASFVTPSSPEKKAAPKETTVLVIAVRNDTVADFRDVISGAGLTQDFFEVEVFSSVRASVEHDLSTVLVADFGAARTKLVFMDGGVVRDVHVINRGGEDLTESLMASFGLSFHDAEHLKKEKGLNTENDAERENMSQSLDFIVSELKNVVYRFEQKYGVTVDKMICSGGTARLPGFVSYMEEKLPFAVRLADPFSQAEAPEFLHGALAQAGPEFAIAIGLCVRALRG